jgi:hypothetical protein
MPKQQTLSAEQRKLNDVWEAHLRAEFEAHSPDEAIDTMVANPVGQSCTGDDGRQMAGKRCTNFTPAFPAPDSSGCGNRARVAHRRPRPGG